jgi:hypothetical protein
MQKYISICKYHHTIIHLYLQTYRLYLKINFIFSKNIASMSKKNAYKYVQNTYLHVFSMAEKIKALTFAISICFPWKTHRKMHIYIRISKMLFIGQSCIYKVLKILQKSTKNHSYIYHINFFI